MTAANEGLMARGSKDNNPNYRHINLQVKAEVYDILKNHSQVKGRTVPALVNIILDRFVQWDMHASDAGWMVIQKETLAGMLDQLTDKQVAEIARRTVSRKARDIATIMRGKYDEEAALSILKGVALFSGFNFQRSDSSGQTTKIVVQHNLGRKVSIYYKSILETILADLGLKVSFEHTDKTIVVTIIRPKI